MRPIWLAGLLALVALFRAVAEDVVLVRDGESSAAITAYDEGEQATVVAVDLQRCLKAMTVAELPVVPASQSGDRAGIVLATVAALPETSHEGELPSEPKHYVADGDTLSGRAFRSDLDAAAGTWVELRIGPASTGVLEDLGVSLGAGCHPFPATHPGRLLMPAE